MPMKYNHVYIWVISRLKSPKYRIRLLCKIICIYRLIAVKRILPIVPSSVHTYGQRNVKSSNERRVRYVIHLGSITAVPDRHIDGQTDGSTDQVV